MWAHRNDSDAILTSRLVNSIEMVLHVYEQVTCIYHVCAACCCSCAFKTVLRVQAYAHNMRDVCKCGLARMRLAAAATAVRHAHGARTADDSIWRGSLTR